MALKLRCVNQLLITFSIIFGSAALTLACVGIGGANWQNTFANTTTGDIYIIHTANFFYSCRLNSLGVVLRCVDRLSNSNVLLYYDIQTSETEPQSYFHLNTAATFSIMGIVFIFFGIIATLSMFCGDRAEWIYLIAPAFHFVACLFMSAGLAEGSRVILYNGNSAVLYEAARASTIFSFLLSSIISGRLFRPPFKSKELKKMNIVI